VNPFAAGVPQSSSWTQFGTGTFTLTQGTVTSGAASALHAVLTGSGSNTLQVGYYKGAPGATPYRIAVYVAPSPYDGIGGGGRNRWHLRRLL